MDRLERLAQFIEKISPKIRIDVRGSATLGASALLAVAVGFHSQVAELAGSLVSICTAIAGIVI